MSSLAVTSSEIPAGSLVAADAVSGALTVTAARSAVGAAGPGAPGLPGLPGAPVPGWNAASPAPTAAPSARVRLVASIDPRTDHAGPVRAGSRRAG